MLFSWKGRSSTGYWLLYSNLWLILPIFWVESANDFPPGFHSPRNSYSLAGQWTSSTCYIYVASVVSLCCDSFLLKMFLTSNNILATTVFDSNKSSSIGCFPVFFAILCYLMKNLHYCKSNMVWKIFSKFFRWCSYCKTFWKSKSKCVVPSISAIPVTKIIYRLIEWAPNKYTGADLQLFWGRCTDFRDT